MSHPPARLEDRFWSKVLKDGPIPKHRPDLGPCWTWLGHFTGQGYGNFYVGRYEGKMCKEGAHVVAYKLTVGPIPEGKELDHLCRNPGCPNPSHVEPVTHKENCHRGVGYSATCASKTECEHGHPFTAENTKIRKNGTRQCRTCDAALHRAKRIRLGLPVRTIRGRYRMTHA
jgi:hypothetical protein